MHKELNYDIITTEKDAAYDMQAKRLLGHKEILAQILIKTVDAFTEYKLLKKNDQRKLAKERVFDAEPFRSTIIAILEANAGKDFCMSSVYDVLEEKFVENGCLKKLPGNQQTLRNYIHYLESAGAVDRKPACKRTYRCVGAKTAASTRRPCACQKPFLRVKKRNGYSR